MCLLLTKLFPQNETNLHKAANADTCSLLTEGHIMGVLLYMFFSLLEISVTQ